MKKLVIIILSLFLGLALKAQDDVAPNRYAGLDSLLTQFYQALERESVEQKTVEFDFLISSCKDSLVRQYVALEVFNHYRVRPRVMGEEEVALNIYDKWIGSGIVKPRSEFEQFDAELFVKFNRASMLGMTAAPVTLEKLCGKMTIPRPGKVSVLFFYDTSCAKCNLEIQQLPSLLEMVQSPIDFCAVYVGSEKRDFKAMNRNFKIKNRKVKVFHLWDPEVESDYIMQYGVVGTPRMYLVLEDGTIAGRRLEVSNLAELFRLLNIIDGQEE